MLTRYPLMYRLLLVVFLPVVAVCLVFTMHLYRSLPQYDADFTVNGLQHPLQIQRDNFAVPKIVGNTDLDVFYGMGFVQAQDRLWQMEIQRRTGEGRLAEIFGESAVDTDIMMRTYGLSLSARQAYERLPAETQQVLAAYSQGVNAWIAQQKQQLPAEFRMFSVQPEPWRPEHSVLVGKLLALGLAFGISQESDRLITAAALSQDQFASLYPGVVSEVPLAKSATHAAIKASLGSQQLTQQLGIGKIGAGSNAWVVAGQHTQNGQPLLANDPHLALPIPSSWYQAELAGPSLAVKGMTMPGLPVILFGHNQFISWGGTNLPADTHDYVIEQLDPTRPNFYRTAAGWQPLQFRQETILVRTDFPAALRPPAQPVQITIAATEHGPLIGYQQGDTTAMSLKWTALQAEDQTITALIKLNYATDWTSFRAALQLQVAPTINYLYADQQGNIGYSAAGLIPIRRTATGILPTAQQDFGWTGMIPWQDMPQQFNPVSGYIVNANQNQLPPDYPYHLSYDWAEPARAQRIEQLLQQRMKAGAKLAVKDMQDIQIDQLDTAAPELIQRLCIDHAIRADYTRLCQWNGDMQQDPAAAALYQVTLRYLTKTLFSKSFASIQHERLQQRWLNAGTSAELPTRQQFKAVLDQPELWCAPKPVACSIEIAQALKGATQELTRLQGADLTGWNWSRLAPRVYMHMPFSGFNSVRSIFERREVGVGSIDTVNVGGYIYDPVNGYQQDFGASFRQVIAAEKHGFSHYYVNSTGQSGSWLSPHYDDMLPLLSKGQLIQPSSAPVHFSQLRPQP